MEFNFEEEYILCAANWYPDLKTIGLDREIPKSHYLPKNCDSGIVFSGRGHMQCMYQMIMLTGLRQCQAGREISGFLTSKNRFVDRKEGGEIAIKSGQIEKMTYSNETLYSEDLYGLSNR